MEGEGGGDIGRQCLPKDSYKVETIWGGYRSAMFA